MAARQEARVCSAGASANVGRYLSGYRRPAGLGERKGSTVPDDRFGSEWTARTAAYADLQDESRRCRGSGRLSAVAEALNRHTLPPAWLPEHTPGSSEKHAP